MKYLFFDCEFATSKNNIEKICEFGYTVVDDSFRVLEKGNLLINPNIEKREWDWYVLKKVLTRKREEYEKQKVFTKYFSKITSLIKGADFVFGHSIVADVHSINCEIKRYNLSNLNYKFYDVVDLYKYYKKDNQSISVNNMLKELNVCGEQNSHDAEADSYNTMLVLKTILENSPFGLEELIKRCPSAEHKTKKCTIESKIEAKQASK